MKNTYTNKKIVPTMVAFLMLSLTVSILLVQISPVCAQEKAATLTGTITDQFATLGDGAFPEGLIIGVEVNVTAAGTFRVEISDLADASSNTISVSNQHSSYLDSGVHLINVTLNGDNIYASKTNPETISSISLYDETETLLDSLSDISLVHDYFYTHFGVSPAILTGTIYDEGVDANDDGLYDELLIGVEVNVTTAGTYNTEVFGLYDENSNYISISNQNSTYLSTGIHVVYVSLDGATIYVSGISPSTVAIVDLYESDTEISKVYDRPLSETYSYTSFFTVPTEITYNKIQRDIVLDQEGTLYIRNVYSITNQGFAATLLDFDYPEGAFDFQVRDAMGTLEATTENETLTVTLRESLDVDETETIYVIYHLPWDEYVAQQNGADFTLTFSFTEQVNSTLETLTVSITLPKGAKYQSSANLTPDNIKEVDMQKILNFQFSDVAPSEDITFEIDYKYNVFWGSFYPTLWVGVIAVIASVVFFFWGTPKTISAPTIQVPTKDINSFVETYEEKATIQSELESLEERLKKGKIPRRNYKVRKKMLDSRISNISRTLSTLRGTLCASGSKYANLMNQLEVAESKLEGAKRDIQRVKSRYSRGEISKDAYGKLLEEYQNRIEDAESTIDGVLLRLRG